MLTRRSFFGFLAAAPIAAPVAAKVIAEPDRSPLKVTFKAGNPRARAWLRERMPVLHVCRPQTGPERYEMSYDGWVRVDDLFDPRVETVEAFEARRQPGA